MDSLALEVEPFNIACSLIQPGFIKTELRSKKTETATRIEAYAAKRAKAGTWFDTNVSKGISPDRVGSVIAMALEVAKPRSRYRVGRDAHMLYFLRQYTPGSLFQFGLKRQF